MFEKTDKDKYKELCEALEFCGFNPDKIVEGYQHYLENEEIKELIKKLKKVA